MRLSTLAALRRDREQQYNEFLVLVCLFVMFFTIIFNRLALLHVQYIMYQNNFVIFLKCLGLGKQEINHSFLLLSVTCFFAILLIIFSS
jgi:hypothetical protein